MVTSATSLGRSGVHDFLIQRITAVVLAAYIIFLTVWCLLNCPPSYQAWLGLFQHICMRVFSILALISLTFHAWIGMWTIATDYIKPLSIRLIVQTLIILTSLSFLVWGVLIVWGV